MSCDPSPGGSIRRMRARTTTSAYSTSTRASSRRPSRRSRARSNSTRRCRSRSAISKSRISAPGTTTGAWRSSAIELRAAPADREARWELGRTYALLGRAPEAIAEFTELLRYHPQDLGALVQLGLAEKASGDLEAAQRWFERALALDPDSPVVLFYIAEVLYNRGLNDEALAALQRVDRAPCRTIPMRIT